MNQATHRILNACAYFKEGEEVFLVASEEMDWYTSYQWQSVKPSYEEGRWWMSDLSNVEEIVNHLEND